MDETRTAVRVMQDYITEHISEEITIDDLARCSSFSPGYARKLFLKHLGMTPAVYIRRLKLSKSATLFHLLNPYDGRTIQGAIKDDN